MAIGPFVFSGRGCVMSCFAIWLAILSFFVITLRHSSEDSHRMCSDCRVEVEVLLWCVAEGTGSKGREAHGKAFWADSVDNGALSSLKLSLACRADAGSVRGLRDGCGSQHPCPSFRGGRYSSYSPGLLSGFYDPPRECWGHHLFGHVDLSSEVAAVCDNWYSGVLQRLVSGFRKSFPRPFVSRIRVALAWSDSPSRRVDKDVCVCLWWLSSISRDASLLPQPHVSRPLKLSEWHPL